MLELGTPLPDFELEIVSDTNFRSDSDLRGLVHIESKLFLKKPLLLMVLCAHCPFVKHIEVGLSELAQDYGHSVEFIALASNSLITHPQDGHPQLAHQVNQNGWTFPYLFDSEQSLAKALKAACTPDFFLFAPFDDGIQRLRYRGQLDSSRPGNNLKVSGEDLRRAMDETLLGQLVSFEQKPSIGCNIKWHPGEEPSWFV